VSPATDFLPTASDGSSEEEPQRRQHLEKETGEGLGGHNREVQTRVVIIGQANVRGQFTSLADGDENSLQRD
jgi:hypothetical protein